MNPQLPNSTEFKFREWHTVFGELRSGHDLPVETNVKRTSKVGATSKAQKAQNFKICPDVFMKRKAQKAVSRHPKCAFHHR